MSNDIQIGGKWYHPRKRFKTKEAAQKYAASVKRKGYNLQGDFYSPGTGSVRVLRKSDYVRYVGAIPKKRAYFWFVYIGE